MQWLNYRTRDRRGRAPVLSLLVGTKFVTISDADKVRKDHRIVGTPVGCLPRSPFQNGCLGLPVQLSMEEAHLLVVKGKGFCLKISSETIIDCLIQSLLRIGYSCQEQQTEQRTDQWWQISPGKVCGRYLPWTGRAGDVPKARRDYSVRWQNSGWNVFQNNRTVYL